VDRGRALWLIDAGYLHAAQSSIAPGYRFDYRKLRDKIEQDGEVWRAYFLNSTANPPTDLQDSFHRWLRQAPPVGPKIITKLYQLKTIDIDRAYCEVCQREVAPACPHARNPEVHHLQRQQQKVVDVGLATLALTLVGDYDTLVLSSGDGDLLDTVEYLSLHKKQLELVVFRAGVSGELQSRADRVYWVDEFQDEVRHSAQPRT